MTTANISAITSGLVSTTPRTSVALTAGTSVTSVMPMVFHSATTFGGSINSAATHSDVEEERELARLERRKRIADLLRELEETEPTSTRRVDFSDLEDAVPPFSGDDSYGINKLVADFDCV